MAAQDDNGAAQEGTGGAGCAVRGNLSCGCLGKLCAAAARRQGVSRSARRVVFYRQVIAHLRTFREADNVVFYEYSGTWKLHIARALARAIGYRAWFQGERKLRVVFDTKEVEAATYHKHCATRIGGCDCMKQMRIEVPGDTKEQVAGNQIDALLGIVRHGAGRVNIDGKDGMRQKMLEALATLEGASFCYPEPGIIDILPNELLVKSANKTE